MLDEYIKVEVCSENTLLEEHYLIKTIILRLRFL
jgi:hypothetical protein